MPDSTLEISPFITRRSIITIRSHSTYSPSVPPYLFSPSVPPYLGEPADVLRRQIYLREPARRSTSPEARMVRTYWCEACPLQGGTNHAVPISQRARHRADLATFQEKQTVSNPDAPDDVDTLANVFTGLVVTDDGPNVRGQQHSKLFSSRDDFQASISDIPLAFQPPPPSETLASIEAVVSAAPLRTALPTRKARRESTLAEILDRIRTAHKTLDLVYAMYDEKADPSSIRMALDAAAEVVVAAGKLLKSVQASKNDKELAKLWTDAYAEAVALDKLVDCVGVIVPPTDVEVDEVPVEYNTEHHFENPIKDHDVLSQLVILFAIISNVIIGLATNPCNFLLDAITMAIKVTMSQSSPAGYTAQQRDILSQLPTTLESALKTFKLEPKTRILATCPSCHHTHEPKANRLTGEPIYPTHCQNLVFKDKHSPSVPCSTPLLEERHKKLRPIKPFVFPDFTDHLASVLADPGVAAECNSAVDKAWAAVQSAMATEPPGRASPDEVNNVFEAEFLRTFNGPVPDELFINRGGRMRLAFQILLDFFNPHGMRKRGNHDSVGILAVVNLNLPEDIRYQNDYILAHTFAQSSTRSSQAGHTEYASLAPVWTTQDVWSTSLSP
ncbi:hypothetical protein C8F01DRAFT_331823 [Mycena amicta]|nr:hypothetical protein C8F01DRAFT_331823 [Mycena amicta]